MCIILRSNTRDTYFCYSGYIQFISSLNLTKTFLIPFFNQKERFPSLFVNLIVLCIWHSVLNICAFWLLVLTSNNAFFQTKGSPGFLVLNVSFPRIQSYFPLSQLNIILNHFVNYKGQIFNLILLHWKWLNNIKSHLDVRGGLPKCFLDLFRILTNYRQSIDHL